MHLSLHLYVVCRHTLVCFYPTSRYFPTHSPVCAWYSCIPLHPVAFFQPVMILSFALLLLLPSHVPAMLHLPMAIGVP